MQKRRRQSGIKNMCQMIKMIYFSLVFTFLTMPLFAQKDERVIGIFKTGKDFSDEKLPYPIDCNSKKNRILLNDFFNKE